MTSHDDDGFGDESLEPLRSVWLSMPDEEPPSRGLDALLAAARVKADEMKAAPALVTEGSQGRTSSRPSRGANDTGEPSVWQRFLALFQRPQVLALATIMLLIGGAVFINARRDHLQVATPEVPGTRYVDETSAEQGAASPATHSPGAGSAAATGGAMAEGLADEMAKREESSPAVSTDPRTAGSPAPSSPPSNATRKQGKSSSPSKPIAKPTVSTSAGGGAAGADALDAPTADAEVATERNATTTTSAPTLEQRNDAAEPTVKQLHDRARSAAARNECATVRALAKQIARQDTAYHRANIVRDTALASCLK